MVHRKTERGQALILITFAIIGLSNSLWYTERQNAVRL